MMSNLQENVNAPKVKFKHQTMPNIQVLTSQTGGGGVCKRSRIVPVYLSHSKLPQHEVLVY